MRIPQRSVATNFELSNETIIIQDRFELEILRVTLSLRSLATCSSVVPTTAVAPRFHLLLVWDILYQRNCTVELLIRIPPLLYALMGGAISPRLNTLASVVQTGFKNWTGALIWPKLLSDFWEL